MHYVIAIPNGSPYTLPGGYLARVEGYSIYEGDKSYAETARKNGCTVFQCHKFVGIHDYMNCNTLWDVRFLVGSPSEDQILKLYVPGTQSWAHYQKLGWEQGKGHWVRVYQDGKKGAFSLCGCNTYRKRLYSYPLTCEICKSVAKRLAEKNQPPA